MAMIKSWIFELPTNDTAKSTGFAYDWFFDIWTRAESLGFEGVFLSEHHLETSLCPSPNLLLAALAMRTKRIRMGVMALTAPMYHPARLAEEFAMLDHITGGRLEIGLARGSNPAEVATIGIAQAEMQPRFLEALDIVEGALTATEPFDFEGEFYRCSNLVVNPRPVQRPIPPRWITVVSAESSARAGGRGYKACGGFLTAEQIGMNFDAFRTAAAATGRVVGPEDLGIRRLVVIDEDGDKAREIAAKAFRPTHNLDSHVESARPSWLSDDEYIGGTPDEVAAELIRQCDITGAGNILIYGGTPLIRRDFANTVEQFGQHVLPRLLEHSWSKRENVAA
jgi:alkanesulfonate monooxygenase SsuD/methylene tetrahydromethanopterin reductase-like flavin-dependent oxidoreductase (luciferase family)